MREASLEDQFVSGAKLEVLLNSKRQRRETVVGAVIDSELEPTQVYVEERYSLQSSGRALHSLR